MRRDNQRGLLLLLSMLIAVAGCSKPAIHGTVVDCEGNPLPGVTVSNENTDLSATTQSNGSFALPFSAGEVKLSFTIPDAPDWVSIGVKKAKLTEEKYPDGWDMGEIKVNGCPVEIKGGKKGWKSPEGYIDNMDGTISDPKRKLMWEKQRSKKEMLLSEALKYAKTVSTGGYRDWRVPAMHELARLPSYEKKEFKATDLSDKPTILSSSTHHKPHPSGMGELEQVLVEVIGTGRIGSAVRYMNATRFADKGKGYVICVRNY